MPLRISTISQRDRGGKPDGSYDFALSRTNRAYGSAGQIAGSCRITGEGRGEGTILEDLTDRRDVWFHGRPLGGHCVDKFVAAPRADPVGRSSRVGREILGQSITRKQDPTPSTHADPYRRGSRIHRHQLPSLWGGCSVCAGPVHPGVSADRYLPQAIPSRWRNAIEQVADNALSSVDNEHFPVDFLWNVCGKDRTRRLPANSRPGLRQMTTPNCQPAWTPWTSRGTGCR